MTEKINDILFHPSRLGQFKRTNIFKVLLFLFFLTIFSMIVQIIDTVKSPGFSIADKDFVQQVSGFDFSQANNLPNCAVVNNTYRCDEDSVKAQEIGTFYSVIKVISDVNEEFTLTDFNYYIILTKDKVKIMGQLTTIAKYSYSELPSKWQNLDFKAIKEKNNPSEAFYAYFIGGFNQIISKYTPYIITFYIIFTYIKNIVEVLFLSLIFYLLYRRFNNKYRHIFKITVFAKTMPTTIMVIMQLLGLNVYSFMFFVTFLTLIYVYLGIIYSVPRNREF